MSTQDIELSTPWREGQREPLMSQWAAIPSTRFATIEHLSNWFPQINPNHPRARTFLRRFSDRDVALISVQLLSVIIFIFNLSATIYGFSVAQSGVEGTFGDIMGGTGGSSCGEVRLYNRWLHFAINALSTLLLGASNYCAQLLLAPTRREVDTAHEQKRWLDIGVQSFRNWRRVSGKRKTVWTILMLSSGFLHMLWNSAVFAATPYSSYEVGYVTADFQDDIQPWTSPVAELENIRKGASTLPRLTKDQCIARYAGGGPGLSSLLVASANITLRDQLSFDSANQDSSLLQNTTQTLTGSDWALQAKWMCSAWAPPGFLAPQNCGKEFLGPKADTWTLFSINWAGEYENSQIKGTIWSKVDYCIPWRGPEPMDHKCALRLSPVILAIVSALNLIKCIAIAYTARLHSQESEDADSQPSTLLRAFRKLFGHNELTHHKGLSLITVGDAIGSFLEHPDDHTRQFALGTKAAFVNSASWDRPLHRTDLRVFRWFRAASIGRWALAISLCVAVLGIASGLLSMTVTAQKSVGVDVGMASLWSYGLGDAHPWAVALQGIMRRLDQNSGFFFAVLLANLPQVVVSALYLLYNNLLTVMVVASEWNAYISDRKSLRMTRPRGIQRSSYFLSLPYRYSITLMSASGILHWLISQSIFVVQTVAYETPDFKRAEELDASSVGYSTIGIFIALLVGGTLVAALLIIGFAFKYKPKDARDGGPPYPMLLASTCSAAISANCHRHRDDKDCWLLPVTWGFVWDGPERVGGRFAFTTAADVEYPPEHEIDLLLVCQRMGGMGGSYCPN